MMPRILHVHGRKITVDIDVGKTSIIQVHSQSRGGNRPALEKPLDRVKNNLMLRLGKKMLAVGPQEFPPPLLGLRLVTDRAENLEFICYLFCPVHVSY